MSVFWDKSVVPGNLRRGSGYSTPKSLVVRLGVVARNGYWDMAGLGRGFHGESWGIPTGSAEEGALSTQD